MSLACTVRGCASPLARDERTWRCSAGHSFDIARSGYVNLLQPHDKHSLTPGDSPAAVRARRALFEAGFGDVLRSALITIVEHAALPPGARIADLGCGEGTFLAAIAARCECEAVGVDISVPAIEAAAKRHPRITWLVANADRRLPFTDGSLDLVISVDGRRNAAECARVLASGAALVIAVPASDDLCELRQSVLGEAHMLERADALVAEFAAGFVLAERAVARDRRRLDASLLAELALATYRCARSSEKRALDALDGLEVTTSHEILRFRRR
jgi:23S rRNA (guanine745-N1)-methyltransferase